MVITFYFFFHTSSIRLIDFVNGFMLEQIPVFTKNFRCSLNFLQEKKKLKKKKKLSETVLQLESNGCNFR